MLLGVVACGSVSIAHDPQVAIAMAGISAATKSNEEVRAAVPSELRSNSPEAAALCERESRVFLFVSQLPMVGLVYRADLKLAALYPDPNAQKYWGQCVLNPLAPQHGD
jgi:hypothetical protein